MLSLDTLAKEALTLPEDDRGWLVDCLSASLEPASAQSEEHRRQWLAVAHRRLAEIRSGNAETVNGPAAMERLRRRLAHS